MMTSRLLLLYSAAISAVLFLLFKFLYPYPDLFMDSYWYIYAAEAHLNISIWPIGYSKFLTLVHSITSSAGVLVSLQYVLLQSSLLYLAFTLFYFYPFGNGVK